MSIPTENLTPMMKQFAELKGQYSDCILLFRAGDFYETFYDDAVLCSQVLNITLAKRGQTPMAGVPFHSIMPYIKKLVSNNFKVAMCEQLEDPKKAVGLVKRGVVRVITPGTILEDEYLPDSSNNFIACVFCDSSTKKFGISLVDITTGEFISTTVSSVDDVKTVLKKYSPNEIVLNESRNSKKVCDFLKLNNIYFNFLSEIRFNINYSKEILKKQFAEGSGIVDLNGKELSMISSGALLFYIFKLQKLDLSHINSITYINLNSAMVLDSICLRNLEIVDTMYSKDKSKTLFGILNNTKTPSGGRLLKSQLISPLLDTVEIGRRHDSIDELNDLVIERNEIRDYLSEFSDIERITSRINTGICSPRDLVSLKTSLGNLPGIVECLSLFNSELITGVKNLDVLSEVCAEIDYAIISEAPAHTRDIGYIKPMYNEELKVLFDIAYNSKDFLSELEETERLRTGISTLKIKYNRIFGYFIEVPKSQENKVPEDYRLKQTLLNQCRYTKPELKEKEDMILGANDKIKSLEKELFDKLVLKLKSYTKKFQNISSKIAVLDVLCSHSLNSQLYNFTRPTFSSSTSVVDGRNFLVEKFVSEYIPNDINFSKDETFKIITGPNMSGKSTYLRQAAVVSIMGQVGSFIPAKSGELKLYDRIFTRIGAHDELSEGQSTFMVEMSETANILNNATSESLVLLDEIGRGTSTYDGLSIAWAVVEELVSIGCDSIFATHYHQLNELASFYPTIENYNVSVLEKNGEIKFIHKIVKGGTDKSYGVYVGKLAGIPERVLKRAEEIQDGIEEKEDIVIKKEFRDNMTKLDKKVLKTSSSGNSNLNGFM
jgi:DNA mismatch repair protein MutS